MEWLNVYGLGFMIAIMIPNILFAIKCRDGFDNRWKNKPVALMEQIGRFACLGFMVVNIPGTWFGFGSDRAFAIYRIVDSALVALYWGIWALCFRRNGVFRSLALSILPSAVFLFSGAMSRSILLTAGAAIFAPCHILISYKNARASEQKE